MQSSPTTGGSQTRRGLGLAATVPPDVALAAASAAQNQGYHSFWLNNPPGANALQTLADIAATVPLWLGVGVIPLSHHPPAEIVAGIKEAHLPLDRFYLGIGSGGGSGGVDRVAEGIQAIRSELDCTIVVAALGPRMCRLAGAEADAVLLNWLTPAHAERSIVWIREGAESAGKPLPALMAYVRTALGDEAISRLARESANYEAIRQYADHFRRMGVPAVETAVTGSSPKEIQAGLDAWTGVVDEVAVRAIAASDTAEEITRIVEAAAPA